MPRVQPITGLVFAIDFRHNGKDAWYRTAGSLVGTLTGGATVASGGLVCDANGEFLSLAVGAAAQSPGTAGSVLIDATWGAAGAVEVSCDLKPNSANSANRLLVYRAADGTLHFNPYDSAGTGSDLATGKAVAAGRRNTSCYWLGHDGTATAAGHGGGVDGAAPGTTTGNTRTRTEAASNGTYYVGNYQADTTLEQGGIIHRLAVFNITNPAGQDLTADGWSAAAIWSAIFPPDDVGASRHSGYGTGVSGNAVRRFF